MKKLILSILVAVGLIGSASAASLTGDLTNGLIAYYGFNGNANDSSANGYNGSVYGAMLSNDRYGIANSAYNFNGTGDYIDLGNQAGFNFGYGSFTISAWVKPVSSPPDNEGYFISKYTAPSPGYDPNPANPRTFGYGISAGTDNRSYAFLSESQAVYGYSTLNDGGWHQIVASYNRTNNLDIYVNGNLISSGSIAAASILNQSNSESLIIGKLSDGSYWGPQYYTGSVDDVGIWNRALSSNEISQLYAIPEPSTYALLGFGAIGMLIVMWRKKIV
jgi:hypothetical protein